mgnify:CR=1 FL=1
MIINSNYIPKHLGHLYYKTKIFYNDKHSLFENNFECLKKSIKSNDNEFLQNVIYSGFFFDKNIINFLIDNQYSFNKDIFCNLYFASLTHNTKLFNYIINNGKINDLVYQKLSKAINKDFSYVYAIMLLNLNVDFHLKEDFFIQACYYGKAKTVEYMLNEFTFNENIIKDGFTNIIKQKKTGTFNKILKHPKFNIDINEQFIQLIVKTKNYSIIKKTYNHVNFDKDKYSFYLFELLFNSQNNIRDLEFIKEMLNEGICSYLPESIVLSFLKGNFETVEDFFHNMHKIKNF